VFVSKLDAAGSALVYSTYVGGSGEDRGHGIAVDGSGNAYVTGSTTSANFPTQSPVQAALSGPRDAFVTKLNAAGSALAYSTYLGGSGEDSAAGIAVDGSGSAYVTGSTYSANFPTQSPTQAALAGAQDVFVTKLSAAGSALVYSTYLGGSGDDHGAGVAVDPIGNAYVAGSTTSVNFPTQGPLQAATGGGSDVFVSKLNAAGSALAYSTYLGGSGADTGNGIAVDASGSAYVTGITRSVNFPTLSPFQAAHGGGTSDAFVSKLNAAGSALAYSTYLGGSDGDDGSSIAVDGSGSAYVAGSTYSTNFPTQSPIWGCGGAFVSKMNASGSALAYSTCGVNGIFCKGFHNSKGIAVDASGSAYVAGYCDSGGPPGVDAWVSKIIRAGEPCTTPAECVSGFCADGVCCNAACNGSGCDRCDLPGKAGTCTIFAAGNPGENPACTPPFACDGKSGSCPTSCTEHTQCAPDHYCVGGGVCAPRKPGGAACGTAKECTQSYCRECTSHYCVQGVCCDDLCSGSCKACVAALQESPGSDGVCRPIRAGTDPKNECWPSTTDPCGADGLCGSGGACRRFALASTSCGSSGHCNGAGACVAGNQCIDDRRAMGADGVLRDCAPYKCRSDGMCATACTSSDDCVAPGLATTRATACRGRTRSNRPDPPNQPRRRRPKGSSSGEDARGVPWASPRPGVRGGSSSRSCRSRGDDGHDAGAGDPPDRRREARGGIRPVTGDGPWHGGTHRVPRTV
jgi:hypothetical protein